KGRLGGIKCKIEAKDAGKRETEWGRLLVWWQGLIHCSKDRTQEKQLEKTAVPPPSVPPPYSLTHGIYPVIDVQNGEIYIRGETESGQLRAHYNLFVPEPSKVYTPQVGGPACYEPFSDRIERELQRPQKTERAALTHNLDRKRGQRQPDLVTGRQRELL
ncbi:hypothetical protein GOODEAATRI_033490, partial [Goodea atripinnis]